MRGRAAWVVLGLLTAVQVGIGVWRAAVMFREGLAAGVRPLGWSAGLGAELLMCGLLALAAWWWLPTRGPRSAAAWGVRFLLLAWLLALAHYAWGLAAGRLSSAVTWVALAALFAAGAWVRRAPGVEPPAARPEPLSWTHPGLWLAAAFFAAELPHLVFPYSFTDAKYIWACRALKFAERGALTGIFDCWDPARPPLHSVLLWLGVDDPTFQGRLLPLLMFGAFVPVFYHLLRRVAPRLAPWGLVWLLATDHVFKGQVSSYAGVPVMLAIAVVFAIATDDGTLAPKRGVALLAGAVAGAVIALIRRDGLPEFVVATGVLLWATRRWRDPRLWAPLAAAAVAYLTWTLRPDVLQAPPVFAPKLGASAGVALVAAGVGPSAARRVLTLLYGAQGQVFSHYGYGAFAWGWLIVAVWARRRAPQAGMMLATQYGLVALAGWLATLGLYGALTFLGHPSMSTLFIIRTGFGRHLVHFFPFCLLHAAAAAERLAGAPAQRGA